MGDMRRPEPAQQPTREHIRPITRVTREEQLPSPEHSLRDQRSQGVLGRGVAVEHMDIVDHHEIRDDERLERDHGITVGRPLREPTEQFVGGHQHGDAALPNSGLGRDGV
jgi:hypothetical protein